MKSAAEHNIFEKHQDIFFLLVLPQKTTAESMSGNRKILSVTLGQKGGIGADC